MWKWSINKRRNKAAQFTARLYLQRLLTKDQDKLSQWVNESRQNRDEFEAFNDIWDNLGELAEYQEELLLDTPKKPSRRVATYAAVAASLIFGISIAAVKYWGAGDVAPPRNLVVYNTVAGQQQAIKLADGSSVTLNTNSRLIVDFSEKTRRVVLERGEALFDVASNPSRLFSVDTGTRAVTVLGTKFNLQKLNFSLQLAVLEGVVAVHRPEDRVSGQTAITELHPKADKVRGLNEDQYLLRAGTEAYFSGTHGASDSIVDVRPLEDANEDPLWTRGYVRFKDQPLLQVVRELNRYSKRKILIEDDRIINVRVSGLFKVAELDRVLNRFERLFGLQVTSFPDRVVLVSAAQPESIF